MATSSIFSGSSRFSTDLKSVMDRSIAIASLPGDQLRRQRTSLSDEATALTTLQTSFTSLSAALDRLDSAATASRTVASVSAGGVLSTTLTDALEGTYSVNITDLGSSSSAISGATLPVVADPAQNGISTASSLTLTVGSTSRTLNPASHSLNDLAAAINSNSDLNIRATVVRFGTESSPNYRLSIQSTDIGSNTISLNDGSSLVDMVVTGSPMVYRLNGTSVDLTASSRTVTVAPGLKITAAATGQATVTVTKSNAAISDALSNFVNAYNSANTALDAQHGEKAGVLSGRSIVSELGRSLRNVTAYSGGSSGVDSLTALGFSFDDKGRLSFDVATFNTVATAHPDALASFLGTKSNGGFLQSAGGVIRSALDAAQGAVASVQTGLTSQDALIASEDARITLLRDQLSARMSAADSLIASLEQQVTYLTGLFAAQSQKSN